MNGKAPKAMAMKVIHKDAGISSLRISGFLVIMIAIWWIVRTISEHAAKSRKHQMYGSWTLHIGVATIILGLLFLIMGLPILLSLFVNLSDRLQAMEEDGHQQGSLKDSSSHEAARGMKAIRRVVAHILATVITMSALLWGIYSGLRLVTEAKRESKYYALTVSIGVITVIFGFLYIIIGLGIITRLALDLAGQLQHIEKEEGCICQDGCNV